MSDILAMREISVIPKYCSENNFTVVMRVKNVPFACMNSVLMIFSTRVRRVVNWHSNSSGYRKFSLNIILCEKPMVALGMFRRSFSINTVEKIEILYNFTV